MKTVVFFYLPPVSLKGKLLLEGVKLIARTACNSRCIPWKMNHTSFYDRNKHLKEKFKCKSPSYSCQICVLQICDVISKWEECFREYYGGKLDNSRTIRLLYKNRYHLGLPPYNLDFPVSQTQAGTLKIYCTPSEFYSYKKRFKRKQKTPCLVRNSFKCLP